MTDQQNEMTVEQARRFIRDQEEVIKLHIIWILLGQPPLPDSLMAQVREWKAKQAKGEKRNVINHCIYRTNPFSGFVSTHKATCSIGDCCAPALAHAWVGYWCANLCSEHVTKFKTRKDAEVTDEIFIGEREQV